tara:strand:+ start:34 stop:240 length:207 start_codon:yes stop_codon:yes gene_type:complete
MKKHVNGKDIEMTAQEEAEWNKSLENSRANDDKIAAEIQARKDLKASAKTKLMAGEPLTEEEANTIVL